MKQLENLHGIHRACYTKSCKSGEQFIKEHGISFIISGEVEAYDGTTKHLYSKGDVVLFRKNALVRFMKYAHQDNPFESFSVILDEKLLTEFAHKHNISSVSNPKESLFKLEKDALILGYFNSLEPWFGQNINAQLAEVKKLEIIHLLLHHNKDFKNVLFHFGTPGKIK